MAIESMLKLNLFFLISVFLSTAPSITLAQTPAPVCPEWKVVPPSGIVQPHDQMTFSLDFGSHVFTRPKGIVWSVEKGIIVEGQGTESIKVVSSSNKDIFSMITNVVVSGLPPHCPNTVTEVTPVAPIIDPHPIDEFGEISRNDQRGRLDLFFSEIHNNPSDIGFLFIYQPDERTAQKKIRFIRDHALYRKVDLSRLVFCAEFEKQHRRTVLWRLRQGFELPCARPRRIFGNRSK
jgi:hypothetical protein